MPLPLTVSLKYMSTWPTFERTVLLWGHRWWLPGREQSLEFDNLAHAAEVLAAHLAAELPLRRVRLIYQPESLTSVLVNCPRGNRSTLQQALGTEHPAILQPDHAWSHEPILSQESGFATILHSETEPGLFAIVDQLAEREIEVATAWPLASYLHALPSEWTDSGAQTIALVGEGIAMAYHHPADGGRTLHQWQGDSASADAMAWIHQQAERSPEDPALLFYAGNLPEGTENITLVPLSEALTGRVTMPASHPAQLLPARPFLTPQRTAIAASILLLLTAGWTGAAYARDYRAWTHAQEVAIREKAVLRQEVEHFRINATEMVALKLRLAGLGETPPIGSLFTVLGKAMPAGIVLDQTRIAQGRFTLSGHVAPGTDWNEWRSRLAKGPWRIEGATAPSENGSFNLSGVFTP